MPLEKPTPCQQSWVPPMMCHWLTTCLHSPWTERPWPGLRHTNKATALIPNLPTSNKENIQTVCSRVSARESGWKEVHEGSMSEAGILVKWWAGGTADTTMIIQDRRDLKRHTCAQMYTHQNRAVRKWEVVERGEKAGLIAGLGSIPRPDGTRQHVHLFKIKQPVGRQKPAVPNTDGPVVLHREGHTHAVIMNHWKWALSREVSAIACERRVRCSARAGLMD